MFSRIEGHRTLGKMEANGWVVSLEGVIACLLCFCGPVLALADFQDLNLAAVKLHRWDPDRGLVELADIVSQCP